LDTEDVVVGRKEVHRVGRRGGILDLDSDLGVVDAGEVARASRLVFFRLEGERVRVHTRVRAARVVGHRLHLVEVLTGLFLESVLAVEDKLEGVKRTNSSRGGSRTFFDPASSGAIGTDRKKRGTSTLGDRHESVGRRKRRRIRVEDKRRRVGVGREVPEGGVGGAAFGEAPDKFLHRVVEGQADLLRGGGGNGVGTSVLHLLDEVFVTLLREAAALFGVEVHIVTPDLEGTVGVVSEFTRQIEVKADFVVLERNKRQIQTRVAVEEEHQRQEDGVVRRRRHLSPVSLLGFIQVQLGVEAPPALVVLVDALATNGKLDVLDGTLGDPVAVKSITSLGHQSISLEFNVHFTDQVTVARNSDRHTAIIRSRTIDSLFNVFHSEVSVALVDRLEESNLRVTSQVDVLGAVSDELHETTGHFESFCTIYQDFFLG
jgi:hypothetical protein